MTDAHPHDRILLVKPEISFERRASGELTVTRCCDWFGNLFTSSVAQRAIFKRVLLPPAFLTDPLFFSVLKSRLIIGS